MALTPDLNQDIYGYFIEKEFGHQFEYTANTDGDPEYPYRVYVGPNGEETRMAKILKTVAYIVTDERVDEFGRTYYVEEKWQITRHRNYKQVKGV